MFMLNYNLYCLHEDPTQIGDFLSLHHGLKKLLVTIFMRYEKNMTIRKSINRDPNLRAKNT